MTKRTGRTPIESWVRKGLARGLLEYTADGCARWQALTPGAKVLVKGYSIKECGVHASNVANIPRSQRMIKRGSPIHNIGHVVYTRRIPGRNILIEAFAILKHGIHGSHHRRVPPSNRRVEGPCTIEHKSRIFQTSGSPTR